MPLRFARLLVCVYHRLLRLIKHQTASLDTLQCTTCRRCLMMSPNSEHDRKK